MQSFDSCFPHFQPTLLDHEEIIPLDERVYCMTLAASSTHLTNPDAKVFMVLMEGDPVLSTTSKQEFNSDRELAAYKEQMSSEHSSFLEAHLTKGSYEKLYSYTHLLNGFAVHVASEEDLRPLKNASGVGSIHEDVKMEKLTTYSPDFLGLSSGIWPDLGGAMSSGEGVVIGFIDTGINPDHPSFSSSSSAGFRNKRKFKGNCTSGDQFPSTACNGKIVGAQYFARAAIAAGDFNATLEFASPFDADGHGSHTASTAAGNYKIPVLVNGFNYGYASGMAPGARIAAYKALYTFGGYMSDVVAAVDQAVEDGVDILSLSVGPSSVPPGPASFLNVLEMELLFATRAGVLVVQAAGNTGPSSSSILSFSPWITTVAASITDRKYNNTISLGNGQSFPGTGLAPPTAGDIHYPIAAAADVSLRNATVGIVDSCTHPEPFIPLLARGKLIICTYTYDFEYEAASIATVADTINKIGAAGFIITLDPDIPSERVKGTTVTQQVPGIVLNNMQASSAIWDYYNSRTIRNRRGQAFIFAATARILGGRVATFTGQAPVVASYSSRGPDLNNALLQTADVLKPNIMAPGSSIWAAWSPYSEGDQNIEGQNFALVSGTSMATPHIAGIAAIIKQKHPNWSPAAITSAIMTTADILDHSGAPILAQSTNELVQATPFDYGAGSINASRAIDPGLIFNANFEQYVQFLCAVPGIDDKSIRRAAGIGCPTKKKNWCSDLNMASITISNLVGSRKVIRRVTNVKNATEAYTLYVREPAGVNIAIEPRVLKMSPHGSRHFKLVITATEVTNAYSFGELSLQSDKHTVRVPIAVYVSTVVRS